MSHRAIPVRETIDLTPTWSAIIPIYLQVLEHGTGDKSAAKKELTRCAKITDRYIYLLDVLPSEVLRSMLEALRNEHADSGDARSADLAEQVMAVLSIRGETYA